MIHLTISIILDLTNCCQRVLLDGLLHLELHQLRNSLAWVWRVVLRVHLKIEVIIFIAFQSYPVINRLTKKRCHRSNLSRSINSPINIIIFYLVRRHLRVAMLPDSCPVLPLHGVGLDPRHRRAAGGCLGASVPGLVTLPVLPVLVHLELPVGVECPREGTVRVLTMIMT